MMMKTISTLLVGLSLSLGLGLNTAFANADAPADAPKKDGKAGMMDFTKTIDCSKAKPENKDRCETRNKIVEKCKDKPEGEERRKCVMENRPKKEEQK
jgi:hypothetical protein